MFTLVINLCRANIHILMVDSIMENGKIAIWKVTGYSSEKMKGNIVECSKGTSRKVMEFINGLMEEFMMVSGKMDFRMGLGSIGKL